MGKNSIIYAYSRWDDYQEELWKIGKGQNYCKNAPSHYHDFSKRVKQGDFLYMHCAHCNKFGWVIE